MNLLLLLSALLSALSGLAGGGRAPVQQQAVVCSSIVVADKLAPRAAIAERMRSVATFSADQAILTRPGWQLLAAEAPWATRRRE